MRITKHKNILGLLYGLLLFIPFASVLGRTAYVSVNKNAKDSYYGETINEFDYSLINQSQMVYDEDYYLYTNEYLVNRPENVVNTSFTVSNLLINEQQYDYDSCILFFTWYLDGRCLLRVRDIDMTTFYSSYYLDTTYLQVFFKFKAFNSGDLSTYNLIYLNRYDYNKYSYLDNAFEYSLYEITDNDIGRVKFFTWFADIFLDVNDGTSSIYIGFINWYFNYALLVSLGYVLFGVLMWFINWVRRMLEKGQDFGQGGF